MNVLSDQEREVAAETAEYAMMAGWDKSIQTHAEKYKLSEEQLSIILTKAAEFNDSAEPGGRIDALEDWKKHKQNPDVELAGHEARKFGHRFKTQQIGASAIVSKK